MPYLEQENLYKQYNLTALNWATVNLPFVRQRVKPYECPSDPNIGKTDRPGSGNGSGQQYAFGSYRAVSGMSSFTGRVFWDTCEPGLIAALPPPFNSGLPQQWKGILHGVGALHSLCPMGGPERIVSISDGSSNTLMVGEYYNIDVPRRSSFWAYGYTSYNQSTISTQSRMLGNSYNRCRQPGGPGTPTLDDNICKRGFGSSHSNGLNFALGDGSVRYFSNTVDINMLAAMATMSGGEVANLP